MGLTRRPPTVHSVQGGNSEQGPTDGHDVEDDSGDDEEEAAAPATEAGNDPPRMTWGAGTDPHSSPGAAKKKKKKKKPKKKKGSGGAGGGPARSQTSPPRILMDQLYPNRNFPVGEERAYGDENLERTTGEERRHLERMDSDRLNDLRKGAEIHRQVRQWAQKTIKPGMGLTEIAEGIEDSVRALTGHDGLTEGDSLIAGPGFPTGLSINHCAAHYSPNAGNKMGMLAPTKEKNKRAS